MNNRSQATLDLIAASTAGDIVAVRKALDAGAGINDIPQSYVGSAVYYAAQHNRLDVVKLLVAAGADIETAGSTLLCVATLNGHTSIVKFLLSKKAKVNHPRRDGRNLLDFAMEFGHTGVVRLLLQHGAEDNIVLNAMTFAATNGHAACSELLAAHLIKKFKESPIDLVQQLKLSGFTEALRSAKTSACFIAAMKVIDFLLISKIPLHDIVPLLPENFTYIENYFKTDLIAHIKTMHINSRIALCNEILFNDKHPYYRLFHIQRGDKPCDVSRGALKEIANLLASSRKELNKLVLSNHDDKMELNQKLYYAAERGDIEAAALCIAYGADVNRSAETNWTSLSKPLYMAAANGHAEMVAFLLSKGAKDTAKSTTDVSTALYAAVQHGHANVIPLLTGQGANFSCPGSKSHYLLAISNKNADVVKALCDSGMSMRYENAHITTVLGYASASAYRDATILDIILNHILFHNIETIKDLLFNNNFRACFRYSLFEPYKMAFLPFMGMIDHLLANGVSNTYIIEKLLPEDALTSDAFYKEELFKQALALPLKERMQRLEELLDPTTARGYIMHIQRGPRPANLSRGILRKVYNARNAALAPAPEPATQSAPEAIPAAKTTVNWAESLYEAASSGDLEGVKRYINLGVNVSAATKESLQYPLITAAMHGHSKVVELLLKNHAIVDVKVTDEMSEPSVGITALFVAAQQGHADVVKILLDNNANPNNKRRKDDGTALMIACQKGHFNVIQTLLEFGADIFALLKSSSNALTIAISYHHPNIFELLIEHIISKCEVASVVKFLESSKKLKELLSNPEVKEREEFTQSYMKLMTHLEDQKVSADTLHALLPSGCVLSSKKATAPAAVQTVVVDAAPDPTKTRLYPSLQTPANAEQLDTVLDNYLREHPARSQPAMSATDLLFSTSSINAALAPPLTPTCSATMSDIVIEFAPVTNETVPAAPTVTETTVVGELISFAPSELANADTEESRINATLMTLGTLFAPVVTQADEVTSDREEAALAKLEALNAPTHKYPTANKPKTKTMVPN